MKRSILSLFKFILKKTSKSNFNIDDVASFASAISAAQYASKRMSMAERMSKQRLLDCCLTHTATDGLRLEFGVYSGETINQIAAHSAGKVYGFDSFEGLPERWRAGFEKGTFAVDKLPQVADNVELVVGWFDDTLPQFLDEHDGHVSFAHIDCDLYSSTRTVLSLLKPRFRTGTILLFDEYFNYPSWELHEFKAFQEFVAENGIEYDYIALNPDHEQVAVRLTNVPNL